MIHHDSSKVHRRLRRLAPAFVLALLIATPPAGADDWPQWRGPERNGKSAETGLLAQWPEAGPPLVWKAEGIGAGYSTVSVAGGRIFTMGDLADGQYVFALKQDGGTLQWKTRVGPIHADKRPGPRSTPTVDGDLVHALTTEGSVVCLKAATGEEVWRRSLPGDFGGYLMKAMGSYDWRFSESPLVDGDRVVVTPGHIEALMVALNKKTGEEIWRTQGRRLGPRGADGAAYSSVVISEAGGTRQYVQLVGRGVIGVEADTGRLLWGYNRVASDIANIATPIIHGNFVFASAGYGTGAGLIKVSPDGNGKYLAEEIYFLEADTMQNHHGGLILHEGTVYTGTGHNKGFPIAVDFETGKVAWGPVRNAGTASAAVSYADGRLYFRYQDGLMILAEASTEAYRERGSFLIPDVVKESWAHPVISDGKLLLREQDALYCYDIAAGGGGAE
jgi:outer membrane protein assembly factor BamB